MTGDSEITSRYDYDPYGKTKVTGESLNRFRYTGREQDSEDLYYYRLRYFDPTLQRFLSEDPAGFASELNVYTYVPGNPISLLDPLGLDACYINYEGYPIKVPEIGVELGLGHAGALTFDPKTGATRYYEYGRYDSDSGEVKKRMVPDLVIGPDGKPTTESWKNLLDFLSKKLGKGVLTTAACEADSNFNKANEFAEKRMRDKSHAPYNWNPFSPNTCKTFAREVVEAGKKIENYKIFFAILADWEFLLNLQTC